MPTKAQGRQSKKHEGQYSKQFDRTAVNKRRREATRLKKAKSPKTLDRAKARLEKNYNKGVPRKNPKTNLQPKRKPDTSRVVLSSKVKSIMEQVFDRAEKPVAKK